MKIFTCLIIFTILFISWDLANAGPMTKLKKFFKILKKSPGKMKGFGKAQNKGPRFARPQDDPLFLDAHDIAAIQNEIKATKQFDQLKKQRWLARKRNMPDTGRITDRDLFSAAKEIQFEKFQKMRNFHPKNPANIRNFH
uniref:Hypothetical secreted protein n=1 Tax=Simulium guianense TaxID=445764 RepID=F5GTX8_SIMGU